mgnify:CR=1 FL=1
MTGKIARIMDKGFGFITPDSGEKDVFFHARSVLDVTFDELREGDAVTFDVEEGPKGPSATNVRVATGSTPAAATDEDAAPAAEAPEAA